MAASVSQSRADVTFRGVDYENVSVVTRRNHMKIYERRTGRLLIDVEGIAAVEIVRKAREWTVRFLDSDDVATVTRSKADCGCS